jgi:hypothetical protein
MGRSGQKSRKTHKKPQHLAKVGSSEQNHTSIHAERQGAMDAMGIGGLSKRSRTAIIVVVSLAFIGAICALLILTLR